RRGSAHASETAQGLEPDDRAAATRASAAGGNRSPMLAHRRTASPWPDVRLEDQPSRGEMSRIGSAELEMKMIAARIPQDTTFSFDVLGRYACNTLDEALDSTNPTLPDQADARPFDAIILGGGSFGAVLAARLFNLDRTHAHRILVLEAGPLVL